MSALDRLSAQLRERLEPRKHPDWVAPMLATLTDERFSDSDWIFERKLDGERCLAFRNGENVRLLSRNRKSLNASYPEIVDAVATQESDDFIVDGEIVAFEGGITSFSRLQKRMQLKDPDRARKTGVAVYFYAFDIMHLDGYDLTELPLRSRKSLLREALRFRDPLRFTNHRNEKGEDYYRSACQKGWEGVIVKRAESRYQHKRSREWLKFKCVREQEFVVGGYTDPKGSRVGFGALLIGYYDGKKLRYAGQVGTGYDDETLSRLKKRLSGIEADSSAFEQDGLPRKGVHWVKPELVAQVGFTEWTGDGKLRHPRFLGLRRDKDPRNVVREQP